ncbi:MAG: cation:proton antiporter [Dehalococcoidales bacterium]|jgi:CPA2 family monovalent cation:H+ antiporter-2|nr:cation:proton antiporter [Dehalococcoidales bacterium]MDP6825208.1 cation:proton antiporter [Dehalococcoidales bacterium]
MHQLDPVISIAILLAAALVGGMVAHRLRQPVILGYLVIGVVVGPYALGLVSDLVLIEAAATMGVALLMFTLGLEVSVAQLRQVGRVGLWGGLSQILITFGLGLLVGVTLFQWSAPQSVLFGLVISLSSTMVCLKILLERGELDAVHGRIMIALLVLQDIAVVLMVVVMPLLGGMTQDLPLDLALAIGKAVFFIGMAVVLGLWVLPWLLGRIGGVRSRELFLLTVMVLCLGAALSTYIFGLSVVFGAFVIGLVLRESRFGHRALAEITPLRDIFAALFFVSLGMLLDPRFILENWRLIAATVALIILIKFLGVFGIVRLFGYSARIALLTGTGLFQIGEFSFILAQAGTNMGIISTSFYSIILASALITMILTPLSLSSVSWLYAKFTRIKTGRESAAEEISASPAYELAQEVKLVIIAGYGRVGGNIAQGLHDAGIPYTVTELDPEVVSEVCRSGIACVYGDASNARVLDRMNIRKAKALVVTFPDPVAVVTTVKAALAINPRIKILARVHRTKEAELLKSLGVVELVSPEYEASFRFVTRLIHIFGLKKSERKQVLAQMRQDGEITGFSPDEEE